MLLGIIIGLVGLALVYVGWANSLLPVGVIGLILLVVGIVLIVVSLGDGTGEVDAWRSQRLILLS